MTAGIKHVRETTVLQLFKVTLGSSFSVCCFREGYWVSWLRVARIDFCLVRHPTYQMLVNGLDRSLIFTPEAEGLVLVTNLKSLPVWVEDD